MIRFSYSPLITTDQMSMRYERGKAEEYHSCDKKNKSSVDSHSHLMALYSYLLYENQMRLNKFDSTDIGLQNHLYLLVNFTHRLVSDYLTEINMFFFRRLKKKF